MGVYFYSRDHPPRSFRKYGLQTYQEWMIDIGENGIFRDNVIDLLQLDDIRLLQDLHCEVLPRFLVPAEAHTTEGTCRKRIR